MKNVLFIILLTVNGASLLAQDNPQQNIDVQQILDDIIGTQDLDLPYEQLYENLILLLNDPIDLNNVTSEELRFLGFLTENQIKNFIDYRNDNGYLLSAYELQAIPSFDMISINRLQPFIMVRDPAAAFNKSLVNRIITNENNYSIFRYSRLMEKKKGFTNVSNPDYRFRGSPDKLYYRFRSSRPGDFSLGLTLEKDEGERMKWNPPHQFGFDYLSFHAQVMNKGKVKNLIIGDFQIQAGQGLVLGGLFGLGKGGETITSVRRSNLGGMPYTSSYENGHMRGLLATCRVHTNLYFTGFFSHAKRDGSYQQDTVESQTISSLQATGLHRNNRELQGRRTIGETNVGGVLNFRNRKIDAGLIWNTVDFEFPFSRRRNNYNQFAFNAKTSHNASAFINYTQNNFTLFSEVAKSFTGGIAMISGLLGSITEKLDVSLVYRNYQKNYHTFFANAFGESSTLQNETGTYWGWKYRWNKRFSTAGYVDLFRFPWLRYRSYAPSDGHEWLVRFNYQPDRRTIIYVQAREESKRRNISQDTAPIYLTGQGIKRNYLIHVQVEPTLSLRLKSRVQFSSFQFYNKGTTGFAIIQDIRWKKGRFSISGRHALFDTDDYDNRQYAYEDDAWLSFSIPAYYGTGVRNYLLLEYKLNRNLTCWARYSRTRYTDREIIGSGYDSIDGNKRNDITFQVRIKL